MIRSISFRGSTFRTVRLHIRTDADFNKILAELNEIEFDTTPISSEQIMYAILELINNSLRAHKEKKVMKKIRTEFSVADGCLFITIQDWGGGFDTSNLPYDLHSDHEKIDTNSDTFQEYREAHGYMRFGIGLYVTKKTFDKFSLSFIDENMKPVTWESGKTKGTKIELMLKSGIQKEDENG